MASFTMIGLTAVAILIALGVNWVLSNVTIKSDKDKDNDCSDPG